MQEAQENDQQEQIALENKHTKQLEENRDNLENTLPMTFKLSAELLNLKKIQANLAKQKQYQDAHAVQQQANEMENAEREAYMQARHRKILAAEAKLLSKQQNEMNALQKKCEGRMAERLKVRETDHNKLLQRYQNQKKEVENQQNLERIKLERQYAVKNNRPSTATGRSQMKGSMMMSSSKMGGSRVGNKQNAKYPASKPSNQ